MATAPLISVEEYLKTSYKPDAEYVDGVIEKRRRGEDATEEPHMGEDRHSDWQVALIFYFRSRAKEWGIRVRSELRTKTGERRYRVPDVALLAVDAPLDPVAIVPPVAAFEILSPEDRLSRLLVRLADFESMGVPSLYVVDPADNSVFRYKGGRLEAALEIGIGERTIPCEDIVDLLW